mmetsp:Transcript_86118/g.278670  ORF Transcript_86118/g.278670 Transcript_86118/m.278670 type:complete len:364 (+) Transcript_86118:693-1784(+)
MVVGDECLCVMQLARHDAATLQGYEACWLPARPADLQHAARHLRDWRVVAAGSVSGAQDEAKRVRARRPVLRLPHRELRGRPAEPGGAVALREAPREGRGAQRGGLRGRHGRLPEDAAARGCHGRPEAGEAQRPVLERGRRHRCDEVARQPGAVGSGAGAVRGHAAEAPEARRRGVQRRHRHLRVLRAGGPRGEAPAGHAAAGAPAEPPRLRPGHQGLQGARGRARPGGDLPRRHLRRCQGQEGRAGAAAPGRHAEASLPAQRRPAGRGDHRLRSLPAVEGRRAHVQPDAARQARAGRRHVRGHDAALLAPGALGGGARALRGDGRPGRGALRQFLHRGHRGLRAGRHGPVGRGVAPARGHAD